MDPQLVEVKMERTREQLRSVLLAGRPGHEEPDVFPRSATMRFLLDSRKRGMATTALGALASMAFARRQASRARRGLASSLMGLLGGLRR